MSKVTLGITCGIIVLSILAVIASQATSKANASAFPGVSSKVATTSQTTLGTTAIALFATSTCAARTITTGGFAVMLTFSDVQGPVPTGVFGTLQAASTTVTYDSGQFGCDLVRGYSYATQPITLVESR